MPLVHFMLPMRLGALGSRDDLDARMPSISDVPNAPESCDSPDAFDTSDALGAP